ncbi:MAG: hypothetical protein NT069_14800 [Planctomycetota bacterium]|nr:hypothetical protein [Planctomycetota bacterium]
MAVSAAIILISMLSFAIYVSMRISHFFNDPWDRYIAMDEKEFRLLSGCDLPPDTLFEFRGWTGNLSTDYYATFEVDGKQIVAVKEWIADSGTTTLQHFAKITKYGLGETVAVFTGDVSRLLSDGECPVEDVQLNEDESAFSFENASVRQCIYLRNCDRGFRVTFYSVPGAQSQFTARPE